MISFLMRSLPIDLPVVALLLQGCSGPVNAPAEVAADIREVMHQQVEAWNAGNIRSFMKGYSDTICFISPRGKTCGREAVTENYLRSYPDRQTMGRLTFGVTEMVPFADRNVWLTGTWRLDRASDTLSGGFSLLWAREEEGWRIVRDHSY
jgi:ketosteroid isomerase-like protein